PHPRRAWCARPDSEHDRRRSRRHRTWSCRWPDRVCAARARSLAPLPGWLRTRTPRRRRAPGSARRSAGGACERSSKIGTAIARGGRGAFGCGSSGWWRMSALLRTAIRLVAVAASLTHLAERDLELVKRLRFVLVVGHDLAERGDLGLEVALGLPNLR